MPKLFTYIHAHSANPFLYAHKNHFVSIVANSDREARVKLDLYPLVFVSQKPLGRMQ